MPARQMRHRFPQHLATRRAGNGAERRTGLPPCLPTSPMKSETRLFLPPLTNTVTFRCLAGGGRAQHRPDRNESSPGDCRALRAAGPPTPAPAAGTAGGAALRWAFFGERGIEYQALRRTREESWLSNTPAPGTAMQKS